MLNADNSATRLVHINRINNVIDYIEQNLENDLSLKTLANIASFSPFHFHRIFATVIGENLHEFVMRKRMEKIATSLLTKKKIPIHELASRYGFENPTSFSREFKKRYGVSASTLKNQAEDYVNKLVLQKIDKEKETVSVERYITNVELVKDWMMDHGYTPRDGHCFELFHTNSLFHSGQVHIVDICIPVK